MPQFTEQAAQAEYDMLIESGMDSGDAHENVERRRLNGEFIPKEERTRPRIFGIIGSDDQKRIARLAHVKDMAENDPDKFDKYKRQADAAGVSITGKDYISGLAAYPGDPDAWVKDDSDIKTIAKKKGFHVGKDDGMVKVTVPIDQRIQSNRQLLEKPRYTKPTVKHRRPIERLRKMK